MPKQIKMPKMITSHLRSLDRIENVWIIVFANFIDWNEWNSQQQTNVTKRTLHLCAIKEEDAAEIVTLDTKTINNKYPYNGTLNVFLHFLSWHDILKLCWWNIPVLIGFSYWISNKYYLSKNNDLRTYRLSSCYLLNGSSIFSKLS